MNTYPEELLSSRDNVSDDDGGAEGVNDVLIVGMKDETSVHLAYKNSKFRDLSSRALSCSLSRR